MLPMQPFIQPDAAVLNALGKCIDPAHGKSLRVETVLSFSVFLKPLFHLLTHPYDMLSASSAAPYNPI